MSYPTPTLMRMPNPILPRPYSDAVVRHWTDEQWEQIPPAYLHPSLLVPSQDDVSLYHLARLVNDGRPGEDPHGRVVVKDNIWHLYDGVHRWTIAFLSGVPIFGVRPVDETGRHYTGLISHA